LSFAKTSSTPPSQTNSQSSLRITKKQFNRKFPYLKGADGDKDFFYGEGAESCLTQQQISTDHALHQLKPKKVVDVLANCLPYDIHFYFASFLEPVDLTTKLQLLSSKWRRFCLDERLWNRMPNFDSMKLGIRMRRLECLVERRSKGKL